MSILKTAGKFTVTIASNAFDPLLDMYQSEALAEVRKKLEQIFDAEHPEQDLTEPIESAEQKHNDCAAHTKRLARNHAKTPDKIISKVRDSNHKRSFLDLSYGGLVFLLVFAGFFIIPVLNTGLIIQSQKIPIVADFPAVGLALGLLALLGFVGSIEFREKLTTIEGIRLYDRRLLGVSAVIFLVWITLASLNAFPLEIAAPVGLTDEYGNPIKTLEIAPPLALLFIFTGLLDLCAGPVFHMTATRCLMPRTVLVEQDNAYSSALKKELLPEAYAAQDDAALALAERRSWSAQREAAREAFIEAELGRFRRFRTKALAARHAAVAAFLDDADTIAAPSEVPPAPANGALNATQPNGQFS